MKGWFLDDDYYSISGACPSLGVLDTHCGTYLKRWELSGSEYLVQFHTDSSVQKTGFTMDAFLGKLVIQNCLPDSRYHFLIEIIWTASSEFGTYRICEQRRFRRACASAQSRQNLRCSLIQTVSQEEPSDRKPDPWPLWMAGHAQLKFVITECSKTQIRLAGLILCGVISVILGDTMKRSILFGNTVNWPSNLTEYKLIINVRGSFQK